MTDPLLPDREISASAAERLAALRQPSTSKRRKPAHTSKVLTAGISATALFGMVAVMGWESGTGSAQPSVSPAVQTPVAGTVAPLVPTTPTTAAGIITVPPLPASALPAVTVPAATAPATTQPAAALPVIQVPVVQVPVAVPASQNAGGGQSNTTTKTSG